MKYLILASRLLISLVFAFSSFVKLNDLRGFSYKIEEYFSPEVLNLPFFLPYALAISFLIAFAEFALALFIFLDYRRRWYVWGLLAMLIFFAFLTFYSAYYNKVLDCGCFGDAIHLTPWQSFTKDLLLIVLAIPLWIYRERPEVPFFKPKTNTYALVCTLGIGLFYSIYTLAYLPVVDFMPYKVGVDINMAMEVPEDAPQDVYEYAWRFRRRNEEVILKTQGAYPETEGELISVSTKLITKGYKPPISDFIVEKNNENITKELLQLPKVIIIVSPVIEEASKPGLDRISKQINTWKQEDYIVVLLSASMPEAVKKVVSTHNIPAVEYCSADGKVLKTIVRSNPGILKLHYGIIDQKLSHRGLSNLVLD